ncbi:phosphate signaling complex protein PhoU [Teichococcus aestuarii]|uniref:phosphate signaling complex protein PhoU n=1 Tax=Teichococcus aestuarii TaxID=568898 RepID=UPI00361C134F
MQGHYMERGQGRLAQDLQQLRLMIEEMGSRAIRQVSDASTALLQHDNGLAEEVLRRDVQLDALERDVDAACIRLLALQQPLAADLRLIVAALKTSHDLERIGDYAANIAKRSRALRQIPDWLHRATLGEMARLLQRNIKEAVRSLVEVDAAGAWAVCQSDDDVDALYDLASQAVLEQMSAGRCEPDTGTHLMYVIKGLERIGDHAVNVAEMAYYAVRGASAPVQRPRR